MAKTWRYRYKHEQQAAILKEFEHWSREEFMDQILELREELEEFKARLEKLSGTLPDKSPAKPELKYNQDWSYPMKIHFLLELQQMPLKAVDLHKLLLKTDEHYRLYDSPINNLTVSLARMVKSGRIRKIKQPGFKALYYALPEWVDKEGVLLEKYFYHIKFFGGT